MTVKEKVQLLGLLDLYKKEMAEKNMKAEKDKWGSVTPTKALYTHARIISDKLAIDIEQQMKSIWEA
jgi:hypothetical protein